MQKSIPRILLTMGEPSGIGAELLVKVSQLAFDAQIIVLANKNLLIETAQALSLSLSLSNINWKDSPEIHRQGHLFLEQVEFPKKIEVGNLNSGNSVAVLNMLRRAGSLAINKEVQAVVTAPVHKAILNKVDPAFMGHTEYFAEQANVARVVMMLATEQLRMALVTTHIPLAKVSSSINQELLIQIVSIIESSFSQYNLPKPKIAVCGINPHAGEDGLLGTEDRDVVQPAIRKMDELGFNVHGPYPSDSLFTKSKRAEFDVFLAMYHDQGLPVVKAIGFGQCANVTLGLPYIRTSVDHGTAIDIASKRIASVDSLVYAINYAIQLADGELPE